LDIAFYPGRDMSGLAVICCVVDLRPQAIAVISLERRTPAT
jgi:hypothetical protein